MNPRRSITVLLCTLLICASGPDLPASGRAMPSRPSAASEMKLVDHRYVQFLLPGNPSAVEELKRESTDYAARLRPDGTWPDIHYSDHSLNTWKTMTQLQRTLAMAEYARLSRDAGHPLSALDAKVVRALQVWLDGDYRNPDWWYNQVSVPDHIGKIAILMLPELSQSQRRGVVNIMWRADRRNPMNQVPPNTHPARWTGENEVSRRRIEIVRGLIENDPKIVAEGYAGLYKEIGVVGPAIEGIQQDYSFHQHGRQLYNGGYGFGYAVNIGTFVSFARGTRFRIPPDKMAIFSSYLLDGERWIVWKNITDYSTMGREITTPAREGRLKDFEKIIVAFAKFPGPRQKEFQAFAARLQGKANAPVFTGNKQFWCSDFMVDRRKGYYSSVKMLSNRMVNGELIDDEGKKSQYLSHGLNYLYLTGDEYKNIFPVWDWSKLPGTTAVQGALKPNDKSAIRVPGTTSFVGGVSDGTYGMAAMDLDYNHLLAKKAWFFFDDSYVALGAGITLSNDSVHPVVTDINQTLLKTEVFVGPSAGPLPTGIHKFNTGTGFWVYQDRVGYILGPKLQISLSNGPRTGRWSDISTGSTQPVTKNVFNLWIDHGLSPANGAYQYVVFPNVSRSQVAERAKHPVTDVLSNRADLQAVYDKRLNLVEAVFRKQASLATPVGRVAVDHPCLLMVEKTAKGWKVSASNPDNSAMTLKVEIDGISRTMSLPGGLFAGSSVTTEISR